MAGKLRTNGVIPKKWQQCLSIIFISSLGFNQVMGQSDSIRVMELDQVTVSAYGSSKNLLESTASVGLVTPVVLQRFAPTTWTNAVNTIAGVRMEERSPGSYRFSVRGSTLRAPFGIRNVKFYWNGIPFTDVNGNTFLNVLDFEAVNRMEIIKGPGSSLYGAGTGGVVLMYSRPVEAGRGAVSQSVGWGGYDFFHHNTNIQIGQMRIQYGHQQAEGYRNQSAMRREGISFSTREKIGEKGTLSILGSYSDLWYQTPGGLNQTQMEENPRQARQATPTLPGSEAQNARISSKYLFLGAAYGLKLSDAWSQETSLYVTTNSFANPFISNYEKREEHGLGGRSSWNYQAHHGNIRVVGISGFEWQTGRSVQRNYDNLGGDPGPQQTSEDITAVQGSVFTQWEVTFPAQFTMTGGLSYSVAKFRHETYFPEPYENLTKTFDGAFMPRFALNKVFNDKWSVTGSVSRGFSPPTLQEVRPSAGGFRRDLEAETGLNNELTFRYLNYKWLAEVSAYHFGLNQTIVNRTDDQGSDYFVNAGKTRQSGVEWRVEYTLGQGAQTSSNLKLWHTGTYTHYTFKDYWSGENDLSGHFLPGVPRFEQSTGVDWMLSGGIRVSGTYQYGGSFYLNDLNAVENSPYHRINLRAAWYRTWGSHLFTELNVSAEKVFADIYSLGYDLNAFGNRFYNPAPKENAYGGVKIGWKW